jgi:hypothetical protein
VFLLIAFVNIVSAKTDSPNANSNAARSPAATTNSILDNVATGSGNRVSNAIRTLEQVENKVSNPEAKIAIQNATQVMEESQATAEGSLNAMKARPGFLRFILGPDYKNAGQVRSEIVRLRNQITQLTRERERVSASDQVSLDQAIETMQTELTGMEEELNNALQGFSLLGWLSKLLTGFSTPTPTPTPVTTASASPVPTQNP